MPWDVLAGVALAVAALLAVRCLRLLKRAEPYRTGCLLQDGMPAWGAPVGNRFTPEGEALRRRARRSGVLAALSCIVALVLLGA